MTDELVDTANQIPAPIATAVLTHVVRSLVDDPESVRVRAIEGRHRIKLEVTVGAGRPRPRDRPPRPHRAEHPHRRAGCGDPRRRQDVDVDFVD